MKMGPSCRSAPVSRPDVVRRRRSRTAFVLSGGGNQGVSQVGMLRALLERDIVPDVVIGTSAGALNGAGVAYAPNLTGVAQLAAVWEQLRADHVFPGGQIHAGLERGARATPPVRQRGPRALIAKRHARRSFADLEIPLRVIAADLDTGEEVVLAARPARSPRCSRAPRCPACSRSCTTTAGAWSTAASSTTCRCGTRSPVRSTASSCSTSRRRAAEPRPLRSPLDVVMRLHAPVATSASSSSCATCRRDVEVIVLPRPPDTATSFDFSGARS